jgi:hypothetical protein
MQAVQNTNKKGGLPFLPAGRLIDLGFQVLNAEDRLPAGLSRRPPPATDRVLKTHLCHTALY